MTATYVVDSGGVSRKIKKPWVIDSGGVAHRLKKIWVIDAGGTARLVFRFGDELSLLAGSSGAVTGYVQGLFGTLTPHTLSDGANVVAIEANASSPYPLTLQINGYAGSITSSYLDNLNISGNVFTGASATFSGGSPGVSAFWSWSTGFHFISPNTYPVVVSRS